MLNNLKEALETIDSNVFYGAAKTPEENIWNYIVFGRFKRNKSKNDSGYTYYYDVVIVREEYIPEDLIEEVIRTVEEQTRLKLADEPVDFDYERKQDDTVIELARIRFYKAIRKDW